LVEQFRDEGGPSSPAKGYLEGAANLPNGTKIADLDEVQTGMARKTALVRPISTWTCMPEG